MAVTKADKQAELQLLEGMFHGADAAILIDYKGINVPQVTELRRELKKASASYKVVKNTLAKRALKGTTFETLAAHFEGTTAVAYTGGDPVASLDPVRGHIPGAVNVPHAAGAMAERQTDVGRGAGVGAGGNSGKSHTCLCPRVRGG